MLGCKSAWSAEQKCAKLQVQRSSVPGKVCWSGHFWCPGASQACRLAGFRTLESAEAQARDRFGAQWRVWLELGFDGRRITWSDFLNLLSQSLAETLFAQESREAPILIAGPAESAGSSADGIWFLGQKREADHFWRNESIIACGFAARCWNAACNDQGR